MMVVFKAAVRQCACTWQSYTSYSVSFDYSFCSYHVQSVRDVSRHAESPHFIQLTGVLCSISGSMHYSQCTTFRCPRVGCPGAAREAEGFVRLHSVGKKEADLVRHKPCCPHCGELTVEDVTCRSLSGTWVSVHRKGGDGRYELAIAWVLIFTYIYAHEHTPLYMCHGFFMLELRKDNCEACSSTGTKYGQSAALRRWGDETPSFLCGSQRWVSFNY